MAPVLQLIGCYFSWLCNNQLFATVNNTIYKYLKVIFQKKGQFLVAKNVHDKVCMKFQFHIIFSFKFSSKAFKSFTCCTLNNKLTVFWQREWKLTPWATFTKGHISDFKKPQNSFSNKFFYYKKNFTKAFFYLPNNITSVFWL